MPVCVACGARMNACIVHMRPSSGIGVQPPPLSRSIVRVHGLNVYDAPLRFSNVSVIVSPAWYCALSVRRTIESARAGEGGETLDGAGVTDDDGGVVESEADPPGVPERQPANAAIRRPAAADRRANVEDIDSSELNCADVGDTRPVPREDW